MTTPRRRKMINALRNLMSRYVRQALFAALVLGIVSVPVTCAQASGPHSMYSPVGSAVSHNGHDAHDHDRLLTQSIDLDTLERLEEEYSEVTAGVEAARDSSLSEPSLSMGVSELPETSPFVVTILALDQEFPLVPDNLEGPDSIRDHADQLDGRMVRPISPPPR